VAQFVETLLQSKDAEPGDRAVMTVLGVDGGGAPAPAPDEPESRWNTARLRRRVLLGVVVAWAVAITAVVLVRGGGTETPTAAPPSASPSASAGPLSVPEIYRTLLPSVVRIESTGGRSAADRDKEATATGTGVIVNANGTVITALHVVDGADAVRITYADGTQSAAVIAATDAKQDIAMLAPAKLPETVVPAVLGGGLAVGDAVVAVGNPLGLTATTTSGVVSGLNRVLNQGRSGDITGLIQFDAAVNPGSSGGPLINDRGQVAGIVVALANPSDAGTFIGIGFAVPIGAALGAGEGDTQAPPL
jgi:S1-C subfamily serine protease